MKAGFIGAGNMGGALAVATAAAIGEKNVYIACSCEEKTLKRAAELKVMPSNAAKIAEECDLIFLGVKPDKTGSVLLSVGKTLSGRKDAIVVSMAAGVCLQSLKNIAGDVKIIRIMPNTPVKAGKGATVFACGENITEKDKNTLKKCLEKSGILLETTENKLEAAGALSGCGPAFSYIFIEALSDAGVECGLSRAEAVLLAEQTVLGSAVMALTTGENLNKLKNDVCSPGGTTIAGVHALEKGGLRNAAMDAVKAAYDKTLAMLKK